MKLSIESKSFVLGLLISIIECLDIQVVAHGHSYRCRRTAQASVVQNSMLDVSCPTGNYHQIPSFDRLKRSASSRYKKYQNHLVFKHSTKNHFTQADLFKQSVQSMLTVKPMTCSIVTKCPNWQRKSKGQGMALKLFWSM